MATTFNVISLGVQTDMDTVEGNNTAENAGALVGITFGGPGDPLLNNIQTFSPGSGGFGRGTNDVYDQDNSPSERFRIDGGPNQTFDSVAVYNATITYTDGTTATISAVVFQDTNGNTYLAPEFTDNADQDALEAKPIQSLTLDSLLGNNATGLTGDREQTDFQICFTAGTRIATPTGNRKIEKLQVGDIVLTRDNGNEPIRWIGRRTVPAKGKMVPIRIRKGALGRGLPRRDLVVSPQHRVLVRSEVAREMFGAVEVLVAAKRLLGFKGVEYARDIETVTYMHLLLDRHEVIYAEGAPTESLLTGEEALKAVGTELAEELDTLFPELRHEAARPARHIPKGRQVKDLLGRLKADRMPPLHPTGQGGKGKAGQGARASA